MNNNTLQQFFEKKERLLGVLGGVLLILFLYNYLRNNTIFPSNNTTTANGKDYSRRIKWQDADRVLQQQAEKAPNAVTSKVDPAYPLLELDGLSFSPDGYGVDRNPFNYPPPPPPPLPPPAKPVALPLRGISPTNVFARTKPFELIVQGENFTLADRIYINNAPFSSTKFINANQLKAQIPSNLFTAAQSLRIEVRRTGQEADFYSNPLTLTVVNPPDPPYTLIGYSSDTNGQNPSALLMQGQEGANNTERFHVKLNEVVDKWRVVNITPSFIEFEDISAAIGVRHTREMKVPGNAGNAGSGLAASSTPTSYFQPTGYTEPQPLTAQAQAVNDAIASDNNTQQPSTPQPVTPVPGADPQQIERIRQAREAVMRARQEQIQRNLQNQGQETLPSNGGRVLRR
jgi:IPT/TIG domain